MIFPVIYAVLVWFLAARFRRRWQGALAVFVGLGLLAALGSMSMTGEAGSIPDRLGIHLPQAIQGGLRLLMVLLVPYTLMVGTIAVFLVCLPNARADTGCRYCHYDLSGLNPLGLVCPECGHEQGPYRCKRCSHDLRGLQPRGLRCPHCGQPWKGPGSGREHEPEELVPIPKHPIRKRRAL